LAGTAPLAQSLGRQVGITVEPLDRVHRISQELLLVVHDVFDGLAGRPLLRTRQPREFVVV